MHIIIRRWYLIFSFSESKIDMLLQMVLCFIWGIYFYSCFSSSSRSVFIMAFPVATLLRPWMLKDYFYCTYIDKSQFCRIQFCRIRIEMLFLLIRWRHYFYVSSRIAGKAYVIILNFCYLWWSEFSLWKVLEFFASQFLKFQCNMSCSTLLFSILFGIFEHF